MGERLREALIIGYDPGTTAGLCVLDRKGNVLLLKSGRGLTTKSVTETLMDLGKPLIVASDVSPMPKTAEKLASSLGSKTHFPEEPLTNVEKLKLVNNYVEKIGNDHERDALAAALNAYKEYSFILNKVESALSTIGLTELFTDVTEKIISRKSKNVTEAVDSTLREIRKRSEIKLPEKPIEVRTKVEYEKTIRNFEAKVKQLENDIDILKTFNKSLKQKLGKTQERVTYFKKKSEKVVDLDFLTKTKETIDSVKRKLDYNKTILEKMRTFREIELRGFLPVIELETVRFDTVKDLNRAFNIEDRIVYVKDNENIQLLNDYKIKAAIVGERTGREKLNFPVLVKEDISMRKIKDVLAVKKTEFEEILKEAKKEGFAEWLRAYKKRKY